tara:strand:- start:215 stop:631 length:417 start_codon:yes stop_codon:yes gene_type:complete
MPRNNYFYDSNPCGQISDIHHVDFKESNVDFFNKHHKNYYRYTDPIDEDEQMKNQKVIQHESVTENLKQLQDFNPTSKGVTYFKEHELNKMLHGASQKLRYTDITHHNTRIIDEINDLRVKTVHPHAPFAHSFGLTPV